MVLTRLAFLCSVLLEDVKYHHLAFRVSAFGLEMPRLPASTKALEVKLFNQESELATLLRKIPLGAKELSIIKDKVKFSLSLARSLSPFHFTYRRKREQWVSDVCLSSSRTSIPPSTQAECLRDGSLTTRGETLLPLTLAHFIFDALCVPTNCTHAATAKGVVGASVHAYRTAADELLGFEATVRLLLLLLLLLLL